MKAKVYKIVLCVIDHENMAEETVHYELENTKYVDSQIIRSESREIEEWDDDHPLNKKVTFLQEFERLFNGNN